MRCGRYASSQKPPLPDVCPACGGYVAVHIRRGDVTADAHPRRFTPNHALAPLLAAAAARHAGLPLVIFSQGRREDLCEAAEGLAADVRWCLDADVRATFHALVSARALVVARSSFSYSAALLSRGVVYSDLLGGWWHQPLPDWQSLAVVEVT